MRNTKKVLKVIIAAVLMELLTCPSGAISIDVSDRVSLSERVQISDFSFAIGKFKELGIALTGICAITALIMFMVSITRFGNSAGNDTLRKKAINGILWSGCALALFGGATVIIGVFWEILN